MTDRELYFEQCVIGMTLVSPPYRVLEAEIVGFATQWDPQPFHTSRELAADSEFGTLVACGMHVNAIRGLLTHRLKPLPIIAAGLGANRTRLLAPVYPDDEVTLKLTFISLRPSRSKPHLGIACAEHALYNQNNRRVMDLEAVVMMPVREVDTIGS